MTRRDIAFMANRRLIHGAIPRVRGLWWLLGSRSVVGRINRLRRVGRSKAGH